MAPLREGVTAWAECVAFEQPNYSPATIDTAWLAIREWLAPRVLRRAFDELEAVYPGVAVDVHRVDDLTVRTQTM